MQSQSPRNDANIVPYKSFAAFVTIGKIPPRRDEDIPPCSHFYCSAHTSQPAPSPKIPNFSFLISHFSSRPLPHRRPCFGSLFPPLAALTFAASSIICAFGLASAAHCSPYRHLELCGIALVSLSCSFFKIPQTFLSKSIDNCCFGCYNIIRCQATAAHLGV